MSFDKHGLCVLTAGSSLAFVFGSVHAFSVFLEPLEQIFSASRADVSLTYSIALVCITAAVTLGHRIYGLLPASGLVACIAALGTIGAFWAGSAESLWQVWLGYGVLLGFANGLGYGFSLQISAQANPGQEGLAMGVVTAAYALGATVFTFWFDAIVQRPDGFARAMRGMMIVLVILAIGAALLLTLVRARFKSTPTEHSEIPSISVTRIILLWLAYGCAVAAGLMATGHAIGIAMAGGVSPELLVAAPIAIAICNMVGSLCGGVLTDRLAPGPLLVGLPFVSAITLAVLASGLLPQILIGLGVIGFIYGAVISVYPAVIARRFGVAVGVKIYGRVFTAWAVAGLGGPWLAGWLYDSTGGYAVALMIAAGISALSAFIAMTIRSETL
ncbi:MAG: hypothetical protein AAF557_04585 [Pseudomonadota bacterium]